MLHYKQAAARDNNLACYLEDRLGYNRIIEGKIGEMKTCHPGQWFRKPQVWATKNLSENV